MSPRDLLQIVKLAHESDPQFELAIADFAEAEVALAAEDPVEGMPIRRRVEDAAVGASADKGVGKSVGTLPAKPDQT